MTTKSLHVAKYAKAPTCNWFCTANLCVEPWNEAHAALHRMKRGSPGENLTTEPQACFLFEHLAASLLMEDSSFFLLGSFAEELSNKRAGMDPRYKRKS